MNVEPIQLVAILAGIVDAYAWAGTDGIRREMPVFDPEYFALHVFRIQPFINRHRLAELPGTAADIDVALGIAAQRLHDADILDGFDRADENGGRITFVVSHDVQAKMKSINHVHV